MRFWLFLLLFAAPLLSADQVQVVIGRLVSKDAHSLIIESPSGRVHLMLTASTMIWKGSGQESASALKTGDEIAAKHLTASAHRSIATEIWANIVNLFGKVTHVSPGAFTILSNPNADPHSGYTKQVFTVRYESTTKFMLSAPADLKPERSAQIVGLKTDGNSILASQITVYDGMRPVRIDPARAVIIPRR